MNLIPMITLQNLQPLEPRITDIQHKGKVECKVRGFSLNTRGQQQLNFHILKNIIHEITEPQATPNSIPIFNPHKIVRDNVTKQIKTQTEIKRYQLVFVKRVVEPHSFKSYPYGYEDGSGITQHWSQVQSNPLSLVFICRENPR